MLYSILVNIFPNTIVYITAKDHVDIARSLWSKLTAVTFVSIDYLAMFENVAIFCLSYDAQRTRTDFLNLRCSDKNRSEGPTFYRPESAHTDRFFYRRQKVGPTLGFFIGV